MVKCCVFRVRDVRLLKGFFFCPFTYVYGKPPGSVACGPWARAALRGGRMGSCRPGSGRCARRACGRRLARRRAVGGAVVRCSKLGELLDPFACACSRRRASDAHTAGSPRSRRRPLVCPGLANAHASPLAAPSLLAPSRCALDVDQALTQPARSASVYPPSPRYRVQVQANPEKAMQQVLAMVSLPLLSLSSVSAGSRLCCLNSV